jgi:hypothetical protein
MVGAAHPVDSEAGALPVGHDEDNVYCDWHDQQYREPDPAGHPVCQEIEESKGERADEEVGGCLGNVRVDM